MSITAAAIAALSAWGGLASWRAHHHASRAARADERVHDLIRLRSEDIAEANNQAKVHFLTMRDQRDKIAALTADIRGASDAAEHFSISLPSRQLDQLYLLSGRTGTINTGGALVRITACDPVDVLDCRSGRAVREFTFQARED